MEYLEEIDENNSNQKISEIIAKIADNIFNAIEQKAKEKNFNINEDDLIKQVVFLGEIFDEVKSRIPKEDITQLIKSAFEEILGETFKEYEKLIDNKENILYENFINFVFWFITRNIKNGKKYLPIPLQGIVWLYYKTIKGMIESYVKPHINHKEKRDDMLNKLLNVLSIIKDRRYDFKYLVKDVIKTVEEYKTFSDKEFDLEETENINKLIGVLSEYMNSIRNLNNIISSIEKQVVEEKLGEIKKNLKTRLAQKLNKFIKETVLGVGKIVKEVKEEGPLAEIKKIFNEIYGIIQNKGEEIEYAYGRAWFLLNYLFNNFVIGKIPEKQDLSKKKEPKIKHPEIGVKVTLNIDFRKHIEEIQKKMIEIKEDIKLTQNEMKNLQRFMAMISAPISPEKFGIRRVYEKSEQILEEQPVDLQSIEMDKEIFVPQPSQVVEEIKKSQSNININNKIYKESSINFKDIIDFVKNIFDNIKEFINIVIKIIGNYRKISKNLSQIEKELNIINDLLKEEKIVKSRYNNKFIQIKAYEEIKEENNKEQLPAWFGLKFAIKGFLDSIFTINKKMKEMGEDELIRLLNNLVDQLERHPNLKLEEIAELNELYDLILQIERIKLTTGEKKEVLNKMYSILRTLDIINTRIADVSKEIYLKFKKNEEKGKEVILQLVRKRVPRTPDVMSFLEKMAFEDEEMIMRFMSLAENMYINEKYASNLLDKIKIAIRELSVEINARLIPTRSTYDVNFVFNYIEKTKQKVDEIKKQFEHSEDVYVPFHKLKDDEKKRVILALKEKFKSTTFKNLVEDIRKSISAIDKIIENEKLFGSIKDKLKNISNDILSVLKIYDEIMKDKPSIDEITKIFQSKGIKTPIEIFNELNKIEYIKELIDTLDKIKNVKVRNKALNLSAIHGVVREIIEEILKEQEETNKNIIKDKAERDKIVKKILDDKQVKGDERDVIENIINLLPFYLTDEDKFDESVLKYLFDLLSYDPKQYSSDIIKKSSTDIIILLNNLQELVERFGEEYIKYLTNVNEILDLGIEWFSKLSEAIRNAEQAEMTDKKPIEQAEIIEEKPSTIKKIKDFINRPVEYLEQAPQSVPTAPTFAAAEIKKEILRKIAYYTPNYMTYKEYDLSGNRLKLLNANNEKFIILSKDKDLNVGDKVEITKYPISKVGIITKKESDTMYKVVFDGMEDLIHIMYLKKIN